MSFNLYAIGNALVDSEYLVNDAFLTAQNIQKGQMTATWTYDNGASTVRAAPALEYLTTNPLVLQNDSEGGKAWLNERLPGGEVRRRSDGPR